MCVEMKMNCDWKKTLQYFTGLIQIILKELNDETVLKFLILQLQIYVYSC